METLELLYQSILKGKSPETRIYTEKALDENIPPQEIISKGMNLAMEEVGLRFSQHELFLPEMMVAARAMKEGMGIIEPHIVGGSVATMGKMVLGTVKDDLHDVGKNLVGMMFKGAGFDVVDLGIDVPKEKFLESIQRENPEFVGISALLTITLPNVIKTIEFIRESTGNENFKILVGGAPVTSEFAKDAKADGYATDAGSAIQTAKRMMGK
ncbi:MAG: cobalamin-binding protein [Deltaproteobacteria bacterium]|jgi:5-methyltetrahydrofolate--homocysteine methyltransferase|nr:cobalamin-binding protein [Deltaproteobacteria bacterium]